MYKPAVLPGSYGICEAPEGHFAFLNLFQNQFLNFHGLTFTC